MNRGAALALGLSMSLAPALGGCGQQTLDAGEFESKLKRQLDRSAGVTSRSVSCPDDVVAESGRAFPCTLVAPDGDSVRVDVRLTNDEGGFSASVPREQFR